MEIRKAPTGEFLITLHMWSVGSVLPRLVKRRGSTSELNRQGAFAGKHRQGVATCLASGLLVICGQVLRVRQLGLDVDRSRFLTIRVRQHQNDRGITAEGLAVPVQAVPSYRWSPALRAPGPQQGSPTGRRRSDQDDLHAVQPPGNLGAHSAVGAARLAARATHRAITVRDRPSMGLMRSEAFDLAPARWADMASLSRTNGDSNESREPVRVPRNRKFGS